VPQQPTDGWAQGSDGSRAPVARSYVVKQSLRPIRGTRDFRRAQTLCGRACCLDPAGVGQRLSLTVTDLRPKTTYFYVIAARDNVSSRPGPRCARMR